MVRIMPVISTLFGHLGVFMRVGDAQCYSVLEIDKRVGAHCIRSRSTTPSEVLALCQAMGWRAREVRIHSFKRNFRDCLGKFGG